jgi:hypothetical protein
LCTITKVAWTLLIVVSKFQEISMNKGYILQEIGEGLIHEPTIKRKETKYLRTKKEEQKEFAQ